MTRATHPSTTHDPQRPAAPSRGLAATMHEPVTVWFERDVPARLVHAGRRWRVTDRPTQLWGEPAFSHELLTHPPRGVVGWRFQATATDGTTHMFEVVRDDHEGPTTWELVRVYD